MTPRLSAGRPRCRPVRSACTSRHAVLGSLTIITGEQDVRHLSTCRAAPAFCAKTQNVRRAKTYYLHGKVERRGGLPAASFREWSGLLFPLIDNSAWQEAELWTCFPHQRQ
ncbi:hypothetical protein E2C01_003336 [Portunus trituberculatus]|uniref:Uncharacterized protein n=1 Tax=Portunus trituberculatus TaxID=210409 RepID=A0A5B7CQU0_PORTR|nr:hypothetical protein [Portunus trituberculatus]